MYTAFRNISRTLFACLMILALLLPCTAYAAKGRGEINYYVTVDQTNQIVTVYSKATNQIVRQMLCSAGVNGATPDATYSMPVGTTAMDRTDWYHFTGFGVYAKYPTRVFKGVLFHSITYNKRTEDSMSKLAIEAYGFEDSHGCIRLLVEDAKWIQDHCPIGTKVKVYHSNRKENALREKLYIEHFTEDSGMSYSEWSGGVLSSYSTGDDVAKLQDRMRELGYYTGSVSGVWDDATSSAIIYAQVMLGTTVTGDVDTEFITALYADDAPAVPGYDFSEYMFEPAIRLLQTNLSRLGLYTGEIDGVFDFEVSEAVAKFQSAYGYEADGSPTVIEQEAIQYEADKAVEKLGENVTAEVVTDSIQTATVNFDKSIRLRAKPDTESAEVATYRNGSMFVLLEKGDTWSKLQSGSNIGYMKNKYLEFGAFSCSYLKITGSSGSYTIGCTLEDLQKGKAKPFESFKDYYDQLCAHRRSLVKEAAKTIESNTKTTARTTLEVSTGSDAKLNLREAPSSDATVLDELENGTHVVVTAQEDGWARVEVNNMFGYVASQYLSTIVTDYSSMMNTTPVSATINTTEGFAYVFSAPDKNTKLKTYDTAGQQAYVLTGSTVMAYASTNGFTYVQYTDKNKNTCYGFVKSDTLTSAVVDFAAMSAAAESETVEEEDEDDIQLIAYVRENVGTVELFSSPSTDSSVVGTLSSGTSLNVLEVNEETDWDLVESNGVKGYVQDGALRFDNN